MLSVLGDPRGRDHLADFAAGLGLTGPLRVDAARRLAVLGDPRGLDILAELASGRANLSTGKLDRRRTKTAHMMATYFFDHPQRHSMAATYYGSQVCGLQRVEAAATLGMLGDSRAAALLSALVTGADIDLLAEHRVIAADSWSTPTRCASMRWWTSQPNRGTGAKRGLTQRNSSSASTIPAHSTSWRALRLTRTWTRASSGELPSTCVATGRDYVRLVRPGKLALACAREQLCQ